MRSSGVNFHQIGSSFDNKTRANLLTDHSHHKASSSQSRLMHSGNYQESRNMTPDQQARINVTWHAQRDTSNSSNSLSQTRKVVLSSKFHESKAKMDSEMQRQDLSVKNDTFKGSASFQHDEPKTTEEDEEDLSVQYQQHDYSGSMIKDQAPNKDYTNGITRISEENHSTSNRTLSNRVNNVTAEQIAQLDFSFFSKVYNAYNIIWQ